MIWIISCGWHYEGKIPVAYAASEEEAKRLLPVVAVKYDSSMVDFWDIESVPSAEEYLS